MQEGEFPFLCDRIDRLCRPGGTFSLIPSAPAGEDEQARELQDCR